LKLKYVKGSSHRKNFAISNNKKRNTNLVILIYCSRWYCNGLNFKTV